MGDLHFVSISGGKWCPHGHNISSISNSWTPEERQVQIQKFATTGLDYTIQFTNTIASLELLEHASILC